MTEDIMDVDRAKEPYTYINISTVVTLGQTITRLQEQLNEANDVIKTTNTVSGNIDLSQLVYEDRRKIDGITMLTESYLEKYNIS